VQALLALAKPIELSEVHKHVGDTVKVEGKIYSVKTFRDNPSAPTLINLGGDFPNQLLTIAVFDSYKTDKVAMPTENNKGDKVIITYSLFMLSANAVVFLMHGIFCWQLV